MGLLDRLRARLAHSFGSTADADLPDEGVGFGYECAACGIGVRDPDDPCPVCGSGDIVPAGELGTLSAPSPGATRRSVSPPDEEAVERLRESGDE